MMSPISSSTSNVVSSRASPTSAMMSPTKSPTSAMILQRTSSADAMLSPRRSLTSALTTPRKQLRENSKSISRARSALGKKPVVAGRGAQADGRNTSPVAEVDRSTEKKPVPVLEADEYFGFEKIRKLDFQNYDEYLQGLQKALVMFYEPSSQDSINPGKQFALTAFQSTDREHGFASVDCSKESQLCHMERISSLPQFKLFTLGLQRGTIQDPAQFDAKVLKNLLNSPPDRQNLSSSLKSPTLPLPPLKPESPTTKRKQVV